MGKYWWAVPALFLMVLSGPRSLRADTITQGLAFTQLSQLPSGSEGASWTVNDFNPTDGTLTSVNIDISGAVGWTPSSPSDLLYAGLSAQQLGTLSLQTVGSSGNVSFSETLTSPTDLAAFTGAGTNILNLFLVTNAPGDISGGFFSGLLTYTYTPVATPEPSTALLLLLGLAAVVLARKRFAGGADATA